MAVLLPQPVVFRGALTGFFFGVPERFDHGALAVVIESTKCVGQQHLVKSAGLKPIPFHVLRGTHATILLKAGVHPKIVQEGLGHHSAAFTLDVYSAGIPAMQRDAVERLSDLIVGG